jgi:hypothetical protein
MIMFTTGEVARRQLERTGTFGYVPYVYRDNQLPRAVLAAFEQQWRPYLDGNTSFEQALSALVRNTRAFTPTTAQPSSLLLSAANPRST